jgi:DNA-binding GntR family transcriptional regulator
MSTTETTAKGAAPDLTGRIRDAILGGDFAPHQRLIEADLSDRFEASRAAVRTALMNLAGEGLVERLPNRGARVRAISVEEAIEIVEVRMGLEELCARKAAENLSDEDAADLVELREQIRTAVDGGDLVAYASLNQEMDRRLRELSGHATATQLLERLHAQSARHQFRLAYHPGRINRSAPEHIAIIDAVLARDPDAAVEATRRHLQGIVAMLSDLR